MNNLAKVHFIGIGGAGMSGIARVLLAMGYEVSGSDLKESRNTLSLREEGVKVMIDHDPDNVIDQDTVVISSAIPSGNSELARARELSIPVVSRAQMLSQIARRYRSIAVAGTHGKTTTTSMISLVFQKCGLDPTFLIGGELNDIGSNAKYGQGEFLVAEADESDGSLLCLAPEMIVITNIEPDHLDFYGSFDRIEETFLAFADALPKNGVAFVCGDHPAVKSLLSKSKSNFVTYGFEEACDLQAANLSLEALGSTFEVYRDGELLGQVGLKVPGKHNIYNALATLAVGSAVGLSVEEITRALASFTGVKRRFQVVGRQAGVTIVDDYAHHPTEVQATLDAAKNGGWNRVICIFQPHRYSRTRLLGHEFGQAFDSADVVVLTDVYAAGEQPVPGVTGKVILDAVLAHNPRQRVVYLPKKVEIKNFLDDHALPGDLIITMGAGDVWMVGEELHHHLQTHRMESHYAVAPASPAFPMAEGASG
ncbi:MAG: UDP-N-acetylmuramate--L-alanine ligase [Actinobacteria bacterium]|nr:UDP-N-acetylmuramate--L-alanine ligase [Actinomycetota bacterium]